MTRALPLLAAMALSAAPALAQLPSLPTADARAFQFRGQLGVFGEMYRTSAESRRPGETGRVMLNGQIRLFGSLQVDVDLLATSEDGTSLGYGGLPGRQNIRQFGLHPRWSWGTAHLGTFSESYTALTYNGVQVTGGAFDITRGPLRIAAFGGRAAGEVNGGITTGTYQRAMAGGRIGVGQQTPGRSSTFLDLTVVHVWDNPGSLAAVDTTLPPNAPTSGDSVPINPFAVTPEENLVVSATGGVVLLKEKLAWRGELATAVHTRDVRAAELDPDEVNTGGIFQGLMTPRVGTHLDYAFSSELQLRGVQLPGSRSGSPRTLAATLGYRSIGPGYTSLGAASLGNDLREVDLRANVRFVRWSAQIRAGRQNDNLLGQKLNTTSRYRLAGTFAWRPRRTWTVSVRSSLLTMGNGSADAAQWLDYHSWSIGTDQQISFGPRRRIESLSFNYEYQNAGDANPTRVSSDFVAHSGNARLTIRLGPAVQVSPSLGLTRSRSDTSAAGTRATYGLAAAWRMLDGRLATTASVNRSRFSASRMFTGTVNSRFQLTDRDDLVLLIQLNRFRDTAVPVNRFNEETVSLHWSRRL
jgi:hypothetical protein